MIIKIGTDRFWVKASHLERWAEILNSLPQKIPCNSKKDIAKEYLGYVVDEKGRIVNADEVYGLFGVEQNKESITIVGCNFIQSNNDGYELSEDAIKLIEQYKENGDWEKILANQLLKYSVRVRTIVIAMLNGGYLSFHKRYMENLAKSYITFKEKKYYVFSSDPKKMNINNLMRENANEVLGPFWWKQLNIDGEEIEFKGVNKDYPSLGSMSTYLKIPLLLFDYLSWIKDCEDGRYILDKQKVKDDIEKDVYNSLLIGGNPDELEILENLIIEQSDARGFFSIEIVGSLLKNKIDRFNDMTDENWIDHYFITGINQGKFKIKDHEQGQPRHGRGLLGKRDYQLIKLEILN